MTNIELEVLLWIQEHLRGVMDGFWIFITSLGDGGKLWIAIGLLLLLFERTRKVGITVLLALSLNAVMTNLTLKPLIARERPFDACSELMTLIRQPHDFSFPSGHTSVSFAGALVLLYKMPKQVGIPAVVLAAMIGFSRLYIGVHYPTDVLGGLVVGVFASAMAGYLMDSVCRRSADKGVA